MSAEDLLTYLRTLPADFDPHDVFRGNWGERSLYNAAYKAIARRKGLVTVADIIAELEKLP